MKTITPKLFSLLIKTTLSFILTFNLSFSQEQETANNYDRFHDTIPNNQLLISSKIIKSAEWLLNTPIESETYKRKQENSSLLQWIRKNPEKGVVTNEAINSYPNCGDCLIIYLSSYAKSVLQSNGEKNKSTSLTNALAGTESVIKFYIKNKNALGHNEYIEELIKLKKSNQLQDYIKSYTKL